MAQKEAATSSVANPECSKRVCQPQFRPAHQRNALSQSSTTASNSSGSRINTMQCFQNGRLKLQGKERPRETASSTPEPATLNLQPEDPPHDLEPAVVPTSSSTGTTASGKQKRKRNNGTTKVRNICYGLNCSDIQPVFYT